MATIRINLTNKARIRILFVTYLIRCHHSISMIVSINACDLFISSIRSQNGATHCIQYFETKNINIRIYFFFFKPKYSLRSRSELRGFHLKTSFLIFIKFGVFLYFKMHCMIIFFLKLFPSLPSYNAWIDLVMYVPAAACQSINLSVCSPS
jgi:hypothetical protein